MYSQCSEALASSSSVLAHAFSTVTHASSALAHGSSALAHGSSALRQKFVFPGSCYFNIQPKFHNVVCSLSDFVGPLLFVGGYRFIHKISKGEERSGKRKKLSWEGRMRERAGRNGYCRFSATREG